VRGEVLSAEPALEPTYSPSRGTRHALIACGLDDRPANRRAGTLGRSMTTVRSRRFEA
jgi:hypothetical protein